MANPREPFEPDTIYHVYNHGNGDDLIFSENENYRFFLKRFKFYIIPIAKVYAYCLMPNHFHFLLRIKNDDELFEFMKEKDPDMDNKRSAMSQKDIADLDLEPEARKNPQSRTKTLRVWFPGNSKTSSSPIQNHSIKCTADVAACFWIIFKELKLPMTTISQP